MRKRADQERQVSLADGSKQMEERTGREKKQWDDLREKRSECERRRERVRTMEEKTGR